jgi:hypothetical protein
MGKDIVDIVALAGALFPIVVVVGYCSLVLVSLIGGL